MTEPPAQAVRVVLVSGFLAFVVFGIRLSFSVFFDEFLLAEGWSSEQGARIFSVSMLVFAAGSAPSGLLLDKLGPRVMFTTGVFFLGLGLLLSSFSSTLLQLTLAYGLISGLGLSIVGLGQVAANIAAWVPPQQRGRAIGVAFAGTGLGSLIFVPMSTFLIAHLGWRSSYLFLSAICFFVLIPVMWAFLRKPPADATRPPSAHGADSKPSRRRDLLRDPLFWVLMLISLNALGPLRALTVHQIAYMRYVGISRETASFYVGLAGFLTAWTYVGWGYVSDRFGRVWAFGLGALSLGLAVGVLLVMNVWPMVGLLPLYALFYALGEGTRSSQTTALASDIYQSSGLGLINGMVGAMFGLGAAIGPWMVGFLKDRTEVYTFGWIGVLVMVTISAVAFIVLAWASQGRRNLK